MVVLAANCVVIFARACEHKLVLSSVVMLYFYFSVIVYPRLAIKYYSNIDVQIDSNNVLYFGYLCDFKLCNICWLMLMCK